jgi:hypothetical protein
MQDDTIEIIEPTPVPKALRCKAAVYAIALAMTLGPYAAAVAIWYRFDLFFGIGGFLIAYLVTGIVRSKLRNGVIPQLQQEYHYSDRAIASWYVVRALMCR